MRNAPVLLVCLGMFLLAFTLVPVAWAEDAPSGRGVVPLGAPPAPRLVPVPDVRGMGEAAALRALSEAGLRVGGIERISAARLRAELGRSYATGQVVQQAPRPSTGSQPSWLARGAPVWLRVAAARDEGVLQPAAPAEPRRPTYPAQPAMPAAPPLAAAPGGVEPYPSRGIPPVPPPPYELPGSQRPVVVPPAAPPQAPYEPAPAQPEDPYGAAPVQPEDPYGAAPYEETYWPSDLRSRLALPCERRQERWHVRPVAGAAFWLGDDEGDVDLYAGVDVGRTFSNCFGVDVFYRYAAGTFDRDVPGGLLEDSGAFHHVGIKATFNGSLDSSGRLFGWLGLGAGWFTAQDLVTEDDGFAGFGELGLGFLISSSVRLRLGANVHAMDTSAARVLAANDSRKRLLWIVAPTLGLELDL